jgi:site-specific recombinase XerD
MNIAEHLVHERTLLGGVDTFLGHTVHVHPYRAKAYREQLESWAERWLETGGDNSIESVSAGWLREYLAGLPGDDRRQAEEAIGNFYRWATSEGLTTNHPLTM